MGIPNASVAPELEGRLRSARGREVLYAVSPLGRVVLTLVEEADSTEVTLLQRVEEAPPARVRLDTRRLRLDRIRPLPLQELRADASGVFVGPKAANLGQLAAYFPDRVAPGDASQRGQQ